MALVTDFIFFFQLCLRSTSYQDLNRPVAVPYTQGNWEGKLGSDVLRFVEGPNATVRVNVAAILSSENFYINGSMWEGILGLGYARLSKVSYLHVCISFKERRGWKNIVSVFFFFEGVYML